MAVEVRSREGERRIERALQHVSDLWFPVNPETLERIKKSINQSNFSSNIDEVLSEIKGDFSLYIYSIRKLMEMIRDEKVEGIAINDPKALISWAGPQRLRKVFNIEPGNISQHTFNSISTVQALRFKEMAVSTATTELLSTSHGVESNIGYSGALIRQLGHTLIAFNYSEIYENCLLSLQPGENLDVKLAEKLGFSPQILTLKLLQRWGVGPELCDSVSAGLEVSDKLSAVGVTIAKLCEVGEALARANNAEYYPSAFNDWEQAKSEIERTIGKKGLLQIRRKMKETIKSYIQDVPHLFKGGLVLDPEAALAHRWDEEYLQKNPYLSNCSGNFSKALQNLYARMCADDGPKDYLNILVREIIPMAGYTGLCIYTIDPTVRMLIPQLKVGDIKLRAPSAVPYNLAGDPISVAFETTAPIVEHQALTRDEEVSFLAGVLGFSNRSGVIYAEMPYEVFSQPEIDHISQFRALSKAFSDCLKLS